MTEMTPETLKKLGDFAEHNWGDGGEMRDELYAAASAWEADRKARIEIEQAYSDLQDEHMVLHQELGAAQTRIGALEKAIGPVLLAVFDSMWTSSARGEYSLANEYYDKLYDACRVLSAALAAHRPDVLSGKERPGNASCACVFSTATGTVDTTGCSLHGSALAEEKNP